MIGQCDECGDHWLEVTRDTLQSVSTVEDDGDNPAPHDCLRSRSGHPCDHHRLLNIASPWPPGHILKQVLGEKTLEACSVPQEKAQVSPWSALQHCSQINDNDNG